MKKLVAYLLIIIINAHALTALWLYVDIQWQRQSMHARISTENISPQLLTVLELNSDDLKSEDFVRVNSKEIKYKGELYDLVKVEQVGNTLRFYCVWDEHEKLLQDSLQTQVAQQNPYAQETGALVTQLFEKLWVYPFAVLQPSPTLPFITTLHSSDASQLPCLFLEVLSPPPQFICG